MAHSKASRQSEKSRQENCDVDGEDVYAAALIVKLSLLGMPQLHTREVSCGINDSDMCKSHASRNVFRMNLCEGLTSRKLLNCHFAKDVWKERCVENRFPQWERFGRRTNSSWCIVTCAVQCKHSQLEEQSILSRLLLITLGAALYTCVCEKSPSHSGPKRK